MRNVSGKKEIKKNEKSQIGKIACITVVMNIKHVYMMVVQLCTVLISAPIWAMCALSAWYCILYKYDTKNLLRMDG